jgi:hypothetical protein
LQISISQTNSAQEILSLRLAIKLICDRTISSEKGWNILSKLYCRRVCIKTRNLLREIMSVQTLVAKYPNLASITHSSNENSFEKR